LISRLSSLTPTHPRDESSLGVGSVLFIEILVGLRERER
jgi:hypothetical protein